MKEVTYKKKKDKGKNIKKDTKKSTKRKKKQKNYWMKNEKNKQLHFKPNCSELKKIKTEKR